MRPLAFCLMLATAAVVTADICRDAVCEYTFVIRRAPSMTYRAPNGKLYNVALNGTRLQIIESSFHKASADNLIGTFVNASEVTTVDGFRRDLIVVNDAFPGPNIEVMEGAQVVIRVINDLLTDGITLHWHGLFMLNTPWMDGVGYITQCPIPPHQSFTYRFKAFPYGTHWFHDHFSITRLDGLFGMLIIHRELPKLPEFLVTVQDWYHVPAGDADRLSPNRMAHVGTGDTYTSDEDRDMAVDNSEVTMRRYDASLINGKGRWNDQQVPLTIFNVKVGQTYRFRVANTGCERGFVDMEPLSVDSFMIFPGESIDFEMDANKAGRQYWMRAVTLRHGKGHNPIPDGIVNGVKAILRYGDVDHIVPCYDKVCDADGCHCTQLLDLPFNKTIQMVFINYNLIDTDDLEHHPIHMHGHNFAVLAMGYPTFNSTTGRYVSPNNDIDCINRLCSKAAWRNGREPALNLVNPPVRDVVIVPAGGYVVIRFRSNNPGFWLFHCHLEMHTMEGMAVVLREAVDRIPRLPRNFPTCNVFDWTAEEYEYYQTPAPPTLLPPATPTAPPHPPPHVKRKEITCFTFDGGFTGTSGEWVSRTKTVDLVNRDCVSGLCAYFPGVRSRLEVPRFSAAFEAWGEFSISFWLKNLDDGPSGIVTNGDCNPGEAPSLFVYGGWSEQLKVGMMGNGGYVTTATVPMALRQWHHVAITWDGRRMTTYVDGARKSSKTLQGSKLASPACPLVFGEAAGSTNRVLRPFNGYLDQVCLYNSALTAAEIRLLKTTPSITQLPSPTVHRGGNRRTG
ncbi:Dihydrogeodin oxidase [Lamellibrachia satsuma]|nr:Dihydrogeodin oxidase [Lamellibrachia satsuma]